LFYNRQKYQFKEILKRGATVLDITAYEKILDVGCGTGALCSVLNENGLSVTGIDPAEKMLKSARKHPENRGINFLKANVLEHLTFEEKSFDISVASYVAHGMRKENRIKMYSEMSRVTKKAVVIYDYNKNRSFMTSLIEWLERGDYFRFIKDAENEMKVCFSNVTVIDVGLRASWYICTPGNP
jgi:ubiquinone/menaquinone biosynthesis C-methylase UbiE